MLFHILNPYLMFSHFFQITTREDINSKRETTIKTELEPEAFRPNLSDPSELLELEQIEKV